MLLLAAVTMCIIALGAVFQVVVVPTPSMESTVMVGDHLLVNRLAYFWRPIRRGDVVSFYPPHRSDQVYLKRVVAVGGDRVEFREGTMFINGAPISEQPGEYLCSFFGTRSQMMVVPDGYFYVLGDNRNHSEDSRNFGPVAENRIVGAPVVVLWSFAVPTDKWLNQKSIAVYLDHPVAHLRWTRILRTVQ